MEEQAKLLADLTATISSMNAKLDKIHPAVLDLHDWKPKIERSVDALRAEVNDLRTRVVDISRPVASSPSGDRLPPLLQLRADAPIIPPTTTKPVAPLPSGRAAESSDDGHGPVATATHRTDGVTQPMTPGHWK